MTEQEIEELKAEAIKRYPIGTVYLDPVDNTKQDVQGDFNYYSQDPSVTDGYGGYVYFKGTWAEVVSYPEGYQPDPTIEERLTEVDHRISLMEQRLGSKS